MITLTTLFFILYAYSIYKIKKASGSWKNFNPFCSALGYYTIFLFGTGFLSFALIFALIHGVSTGIIP